ncbi:hypothetical protein J2X65_003507 [Ancylobacter sp. 3268]|uniref:hypothetical protein n=1 Tax=Ancylobacter sp. 3268 TaxID=2817752 RepID=UPI002861F8CF|nr:hypothetical protein [Ancylobacter sp. 3268]MDR6954139.1 hypothetical protein [Ancylobacter sp. 3268]
MSQVHNERTKLTANALDRASTACLTVGVLGPGAAALYGVGGASAGGWIVAGALLWLSAAAVLHSMARRTLGSLR